MGNFKYIYLLVGILSLVLGIGDYFYSYEKASGLMNMSMGVGWFAYFIIFEKDPDFKNIEHEVTITHWIVVACFLGSLFLALGYIPDDVVDEYLSEIVLAITSLFTIHYMKRVIFQK